MSFKHWKHWHGKLNGTAWEPANLARIPSCVLLYAVGRALPLVSIETFFPLRRASHDWEGWGSGGESSQRRLSREVPWRCTEEKIKKSCASRSLLGLAQTLRERVTSESRSIPFKGRLESKFHPNIVTLVKEEPWELQRDKDDWDRQFFHSFL